MIYLSPFLDILKIEQKEVIEVERAPLTDLCAAYMKGLYKTYNTV